MTERENVIKGLECCEHLSGEYCRLCPYHEDIATDTPLCCTGVLAHDTLALLKAQEPRVLTLAELEHAEVAYAEDIDKDEIIPILVNGRRFDCFTMIRAHLGDGRSHIFHPSIYDYNKRWRCWTSKPTNKQRQETKWV